MKMYSRLLVAVVAATMLLIASAPYAASQTLTSINIVQIFDPNLPTSIGVGALRQFTAYGNYSDGSQQYLTQQVAWSSTNTSIATVTPTMGLVTAVSPGTV